MAKKISTSSLRDILDKCIVSEPEIELEVKKKSEKRSLGDYLKCINSTKENIMRTGSEESIQQVIAGYPAFVTRRLLSYQPDAVLLANELNSFPGIDPQLEFEFFLHALPKKNRFSKLLKPEVDENVKLIQNYYNYSRQKAVEAVEFYSEKDLERLRKSMSQGGKI